MRKFTFLLFKVKGIVRKGKENMRKLGKTRQVCVVLIVLEKKAIDVINRYFLEVEGSIFFTWLKRKRNKICKKVNELFFTLFFLIYIFKKKLKWKFIKYVLNQLVSNLVKQNCYS